MRDGRVLNLNRYATYYITVIANGLSYGASHLYLKRFGMGVFEWRVMAMLAIEPKITANRVCQVIGFDKGAVSRAAQSLRAKGYLRVTMDQRDQRRRTLELTAEGYRQHAKILEVALERERRLVSELSAQEIDVLLSLLSRIKGSIDYMNEYDPHAAPSRSPPIGRSRRSVGSRVRRA